MITIITKIFQSGLLDTNQVIIKDAITPLYKNTRTERRLRK